MFHHDQFKKFLIDYNLKLILGNLESTGKFVVKIDGAKVANRVDDDNKVYISVWGAGKMPQDAVNDYIEIISDNHLLVNNRMITVPPLGVTSKNAKFIRAASYVIPVVENSVLLLLRKELIDGGTPLSFPGGANNEEETDIERAIRGAKEEAGVTLNSSYMHYLLTESTKWANRITFFTYSFSDMFSPYSEKEYDKLFGHVWLDLTKPVSWAMSMMTADAQRAIFALIRKMYVYHNMHEL